MATPFRTVLAVTVGAALTGLIASACWAVPPSPTSPPPVPSSPDEALKAAFEALPEPDRRAIQDALIWTGDYASVVNGSFGPRTRDALSAWAKANGTAATALMTDRAARARLLAAADAVRAGVGFAPVRDKRTGSALSLPLKLLPRTSVVDAGSRYASADGATLVDSYSRPAGDGGLPDVFDRLVAPAANRIVTYKLLRPDFFVVTGEVGDRKFYSRYALGTDPSGMSQVRGFTFAYPKADAKRLDRVSLAVAAAFVPFPPAAGTAASAAAKPASPPPKPAAPAAAVLAQGSTVAPGLVLAAASPRQCPSPRVDGIEATFKVVDEENGIALLTVPGLKSASSAIAAGAGSDDPVFAIFRTGTDVVVAPGTFRQDGVRRSVVASLQQNPGGTPIVTKAGALAGVVRTPTTPPRLVNGVVLASAYQVADAVAVRALLAKAGVPAAAMSGIASSDAAIGRVVAGWRSALVSLACATAAGK